MDAQILIELTTGQRYYSDLAIRFDQIRGIASFFVMQEDINGEYKDYGSENILVHVDISSIRVITPITC